MNSKYIIIFATILLLCIGAISAAEVSNDKDSSDKNDDSGNSKSDDTKKPTSGGGGGSSGGSSGGGGGSSSGGSSGGGSGGGGQTAYTVTLSRGDGNELYFVDSIAEDGTFESNEDATKQFAVNTRVYVLGYCGSKTVSGITLTPGGTATLVNNTNNGAHQKLYSFAMPSQNVTVSLNTLNKYTVTGAEGITVSVPDAPNDTVEFDEGTQATVNLQWQQGSDFYPEYAYLYNNNASGAFYKRVGLNRNEVPNSTQITFKMPSQNVYISFTAPENLENYTIDDNGVSTINGQKVIFAMNVNGWEYDADNHPVAGDEIELLGNSQCDVSVSVAGGGSVSTSSDTESVVYTGGMSFTVYKWTFTMPAGDVSISTTGTLQRNINIYAYLDGQASSSISTYFDTLDGQTAVSGNVINAPASSASSGTSAGRTLTFTQKTGYKITEVSCHYFNGGGSEASGSGQPVRPSEEATSVSCNIDPSQGNAIVQVSLEAAHSITVSIGNEYSSSVTIKPGVTSAFSGDTVNVNVTCDNAGLFNNITFKDDQGNEIETSYEITPDQTGADTVRTYTFTMPNSNVIISCGS